MDTPTQQKKKILLDASALKLSACSRRLYLTVLEGYRSKVNNNDIEFGVAFHKFTAAVEEVNDPSGFAKGIIESRNYFENTPMFIKDKKKYLTPNYLSAVCTDWYNKVRPKQNFSILRATDGSAMVEIPFELKYMEYDDCEVWICGTIDRIVQVVGGSIVIRDYKTTSSWSKDEYFRSYLLSVQLRLYLWAFLRVCAQAPEGSLLSKVQKPSQVGMAIDGIFLLGAEKFEFQASPINYLKQEDLDEFEIMLKKEVDRLVLLWRGATLPLREGIMNDSCSKYSGCPFSMACSSPDATAYNHIMRNNFIQKPFDPLHYNSQTT